VACFAVATGAWRGRPFGPPARAAALT
jgi:hypothetical protein